MLGDGSLRSLIFLLRNVKGNMGGAQSVTQEIPPRISTSTADISAKLKELPDGAYVFMVDNQGNPKDPVSNILSVENPDSQFYVKYSGLRDDVKDNLKHAISVGMEVMIKKKAEEKIERLQILLALLVGVVLYLVATR